MKSISELIHIKDTGIRDTRSQDVFAALKEVDMGATTAQTPSFGIRNVYELSLTVGGQIDANTIEIKIARENGIRQIKHTLYKDILGDIHTALNMSDNAETKMILQGMISKIINE